MYKIGIFKNGQQIAKEVFASDNLEEIKEEFKRMFNATVEECWLDAQELGWKDGTVDNATFGEAWYSKYFGEDTNNVAVFEIKEDEHLGTYYGGGGSKIM